MPYCQLPLSAQMFELIAKLVDAPYAGVLGLLRTKAIVTELLCAGVAHLGLQSSSPDDPFCAPAISAPTFSARELKCLHAARDILGNEMERPPTIREVARAAGLNETTLKHGFRTLFGEMPFDYSLRCRMQRALRLLREERIPIHGSPKPWATAIRPLSQPPFEDTSACSRNRFAASAGPEAHPAASLVKGSAAADCDRLFIRIRSNSAAGTARLNKKPWNSSQ
jgi:AraC-like DNA-binding protein